MAGQQRKSLRTRVRHLLQAAGSGAVVLTAIIVGFNWHESDIRSAISQKALDGQIAELHASVERLQKDVQIFASK